jgi:hypothetical protein
MSPDPYKASGGPGNPGSWNRYAYTKNDPVNHTDHNGTQVDGDGAGVCGVDASSPLCDANDGTGSAGGSGSGGGCVLDGVPTDCTFLDALGRAGALDQDQGALARLAQAGVTVAESAVQSVLNATPCANLFSLPSGVTPWSVLQNQVVFTYFQQHDVNVYGETKTGSNGTAVININTDPGNPSLSASSTSMAGTIIHELIHVVYDLYGSSAVAGARRLGWVQGDGDSTSAEATNAQIVNSNCFPGLHY